MIVDLIDVVISGFNRFFFFLGQTVLETIVEVRLLYLRKKGNDESIC